MLQFERSLHNIDLQLEHLSAKAVFIRLKKIGQKVELVFQDILICILPWTDLWLIRTPTYKWINMCYSRLKKDLDHCVSFSSYVLLGTELPKVFVSCITEAFLVLRFCNASLSSFAGMVGLKCSRVVWASF